MIHLAFSGIQRFRNAVQVTPSICRDIACRERKTLKWIAVKIKYSLMFLFFFDWTCLTHSIPFYETHFLHPHVWRAGHSLGLPFGILFELDRIPRKSGFLLGGELPTVIVFVGENFTLVISMGFLWGQCRPLKKLGWTNPPLNDSWGVHQQGVARVARVPSRLIDVPENRCRDASLFARLLASIHHLKNQARPGGWISIQWHWKSSWMLMGYCQLRWSWWWFRWRFWNGIMGMLDHLRWDLNKHLLDRPLSLPSAVLKHDRHTNLGMIHFFECSQKTLWEKVFGPQKNSKVSECVWSSMCVCPSRRIRPLLFGAEPTDLSQTGRLWSERTGGWKGDFSLLDLAWPFSTTGQFLGQRRACV